MHTERQLRRGILLMIVAVLTVATACGPELGPISKLNSIPAPQLPETSDPSVVRNGSTYYVYGSNNHVRAPITTITDLDRVMTLPQKNAVTREGMPTKPAWAAKSQQLWAPTVGYFNSRWIMYFSADRMNPPQPHNPQCIGRAFATSPLGPFVPEAKPIHCGLNGRGGALDPQLFTDAQGRHWLLAAFGDTESPIHTIRLDNNGNITGKPVAILSRQHRWEYHFIENPAMIYDATKKNYLLAYSAGKWWESGYSTGIARCASPTGPCTSDPSGPWIATSNRRSGPGGLSFFTKPGGVPYAIFSTHVKGRESQTGGRSATMMPFTVTPAVGLGEVTK